MTKVSVVIPTYNRAEFLRAAIASVLNQTFQDFEIIVVDDGSKDDTHSVVSSFNDKRIKYIRHDVNKGISLARNSGIINSHGRYIAFLDDDDEWLSEKLGKQVDLLENSPSKVGGVYTGFVEIDRVNRQILAQRIPTKRGNIFNDILIENCIATSCLLLRKECFDKVGLFDECIPFGEDYDMWIRISKEFHFEYVKDSLIKYYVGGDKLSTNLEIIIKGKEIILRKYSDLFALNRKGYSYYNLLLGVAYCNNKNTKKGRQAFLRAIRLYPFEIRPYFNLGISLLGAGAFKKLKEIKDKVVASLRNSEI